MSQSVDVGITFEQLIEGLYDIFNKEKKKVVIEEVQAFMNR